MTVTATILADSLFPNGKRLTTFLLTYGRMVHPEMLRDRRFSHSVGSSRAVPVMRSLRNIVDDPAEPIEWGANRPGMVASEQLTGIRRAIVKGAWHATKWAALCGAYVASKAGAHKQVANRMVEPWSHTTQVLTADSFEGFFALRIHPHADPSIRQVAVKMHRALSESAPVELKEGEWHLPFVKGEEMLRYSQGVCALLSGARCARTSYLNHDRSEPSIANDMNLAKRLIADKHWSPFEHQARPFQVEDYRVLNMHEDRYGENMKLSLAGNFSPGIAQHRKLLETDRGAEGFIAANAVGNAA